MGLQAHSAASLEGCLQKSNSIEHRLERQDATRACFSLVTSGLKKETCFSILTRHKQLLNTSQLQQTGTSACFYESSAHTSIKDCLNSSTKFKGGVDHDEAVFFCYQNFQEKLSKKDCLMTAEHMVFSAKRDYLVRHCLQN